MDKILTFEFSSDTPHKTDWNLKFQNTFKQYETHHNLVNSWISVPMNLSITATNLISR